jgi:hypothetical protein
MTISKGQRMFIGIAIIAVVGISAVGCQQQPVEKIIIAEAQQPIAGPVRCSKFNRPADSRDGGFGDTPEQVAAFRSPGIQTLLDYHRAVLERSKRYFLTLAKTELDRELNEPMFQPVPTVGVRLISIMDDAMVHAGQAAYVRGLRQGKGWQKY